MCRNNITRLRFGSAWATVNTLLFYDYQQLEGHDLLAHLLQSEELNRTNEKMAYYLQLAKLHLQAFIEVIQCSASRILTKKQLALLTEGR